MTSKLIVANWKMNGSLAANQTLLKEIVLGLSSGESTNQNIVLAVPAPYFSQVSNFVRPYLISIASQDISSHANGAYTGETSATMLRDFDVRYCLIGHSERRQYHGESDELVAEKAKAALAFGIKPIVCVGETLAEREAGKTMEVVKRQLAAVIHLNGHCISEIVVAYEPVWAIGTGKTATPEQAEEVHATLRLKLNAATKFANKIPLLYGGSVNAENAASLFSKKNIDGGLVGGASLKSQDFLTIIKASRGL